MSSGGHSGRLRAWVGRRAKARDAPVVAHDLVDDCQAYLSGDYIGFLEQHNLPVPGWAWLNALAHGSHERLEQLASKKLTTGRGR
jgi:hypothetical protein